MIRSGAAGRRGPNFAEMLMRMYRRWAERTTTPPTCNDHSYAEEAGLKRATFAVKCQSPTARSLSEAGTHRLDCGIARSTTGAAGTGTRFARVEPWSLSSTRTDEIDQSRTDDIRVDVYRYSGPGDRASTNHRLGRLGTPPGLPTSLVSARTKALPVAGTKATADGVRQGEAARAQQRARRRPSGRAARATPVAGFSWDANRCGALVLHPYQMVPGIFATDFETAATRAAVFDGDHPKGSFQRGWAGIRLAQARERGADGMARRRRGAPGTSETKTWPGMNGGQTADRGALAFWQCGRTGPLVAWSCCPTAFRLKTRLIFA